MNKLAFKKVLFALLLPCLALFNNISGQTLQVTNRPNVSKPHLARDVSVYIPDNFNQHEENLLAVDAGYGKVIHFSTKELIPGKNFVFTFGGLEPKTYYNLSINLGAIGSAVTSFKTGEASVKEKKTLLFIIDEEYRDDSDINDAISKYQQDATTVYDSLVFLKQYISNSDSARIVQYKFIKTSFISDNLYYLFFIGKNAEMEVLRVPIDKDGNAIATYVSKSFSFYTNIWNNEYDFDEVAKKYIFRVYSNCGYTYPELQTRVINCRSCEISFGTLIPTLNSYPEKKSYILKYFEKLHNYKTGSISFERRILASDCIGGNENLLKMLSDYKRFRNNLIIDNKNTDLWKKTYLSQLQNSSFEVCFLNLHGLPTYHDYGITISDINSLSDIKTLAFLLASCNTGDYHAENYLAGTYLIEGNTLFVHAYNSPIMFTGEYVKYFFDKSNPYCFFNNIAAGKCISDAIRIAQGTATIDVNFGDPLLSLSQSNTGLSILNRNQMVKVFPNPCNGVINVYSEKEWSEAKIHIYDLAGRTVYTEKIQNLHKTFQADLSFLKTGFYNIVLKNKSDVYTGSFVIGSN